MSWTKTQIEYHKEAARTLDAIISEAFGYIKQFKNVSEYEIREYILTMIKKAGMKVFDWNVIVAFGKNTQYVHYFPSQYCRKLKAGDLIMIDAWAALKKTGAPYADITRMAVSQFSINNYELRKIHNYYNLLIGAQDKALALLRSKLRNKELPSGSEVDLAAREFLAKELKLPVPDFSPKRGLKPDLGIGINKVFPHTLGHSLGNNNPHGKLKGFRPKNIQAIQAGMGYTIEPGLYFKNKYGLRSEIDIFIDMNYNLEITTKRYKKLEII